MSDIFIKYSDTGGAYFDSWSDLFDFADDSDLSHTVVYAIEVTADAQTYYRTTDDVVQIYKEHMQQVADEKRHNASLGVRL